MKPPYLASHAQENDDTEPDAGSDPDADPEDLPAGPGSSRKKPFRGQMRTPDKVLPAALIAGPSAQPPTSSRNPSARLHPASIPASGMGHGENGHGGNGDDSSGELEGEEYPRGTGLNDTAERLDPRRGRGDGGAAGKGGEMAGGSRGGMQALTRRGGELPFEDGTGWQGRGNIRREASTRGAAGDSGKAGAGPNGRAKDGPGVGAGGSGAKGKGWGKKGKGGGEQPVAAVPITVLLRAQNSLSPLNHAPNKPKGVLSECGCDQGVFDFYRWGPGEHTTANLMQ